MIITLNALVNFDGKQTQSYTIVMTSIPLAEYLKSITDLAFGLEAAVFAGIFLCTYRKSGKNERRGWGVAFAALAVVAFLGFFLHGYEMSTALNRILWAILLLITFYLSLKVYMLLMPHLGKESFISDNETRVLNYAFPVLLLLSEILLFTGVRQFFYAYALYAIMLTLSLARKTIRGGRKDPRFLTSVSLMVLAAVAQGFKFIFTEYAPVASHIFLIAALALLFDFALHSAD